MCIDHKKSMTLSLDKSRIIVYNITKVPEQKVGVQMTLDSIACIRTGMVSGRKKAQGNMVDCVQYHLLNLKCVETTGNLNLDYIEDYFAREQLNPDFLTRKGDVLIRLSYPYSSVLIDDEKTCGLLVPSHFAIVRTDSSKVLPEYLLWFLRQDSTYQQILQNSSGSTAFGTISSGFIGSLNIRVLPLEKQQLIGQLMLLSKKEQDLLFRLAKEKAAFNKEVLNNLFNRFKGEE